MKLTVYIVDDEPMAIQYLEMLLKGTSLDLIVIGKASNGVKAIPDIAKLHPDFVFVDISMPVMDGLQMAEEVLKHNPMQKIFILTAYKDFEYAKRSLRIGVADYILKNELSEKTLEELIGRNAMELEKERRRRHTILETNLRKFFFSASLPDSGEGWFYQDKPLQRYVLLYVRPRPKVILRHEEPEKGRGIDCYEVESSLEGDDIVCRAFIEISHGEYLGVFFAQQDSGNIEEKCKRIAEKIDETFRDSLEGYLYLVSTPTGRFSTLPEIYARLRKKTEYLFTGTRTVYMERSIKEHIKEEKQNEDRWLLQWRTGLSDGKCEEAEELLLSHLSELKESLGIWEYTEKIREICRNMEVILKERKMNPQILELKASYCNVATLEQDLIQGQKKLIAELERRREEHFSRHIILALEYIHMHYRDDISVADIAEAAGISEGHLRRCFKKEMSINVVNYLTDYRLDCAKKMMRDRRKNIEEIWKETGFATGQYFSYVFKKKEGITPRDYMRKVNNGDGIQQDL